MASAPSDGPRQSLTSLRQRLHDLEEMVPSLSVVATLVLVVLVVLAFLDAGKPATTIAPFQMPKADVPFTGDMVTDALQDGLESLHREVEAATTGSRLQSYETGIEDFRNFIIPDLQHIQEPPRFDVEVKGVSYEQLLSVARGLRGTESKITGDVIIQDEKDPNKRTLVLVARAGNAGPWESKPRPISPEGLKQAARDLARQILLDSDPTFAGTALIKDGKFDEGTAVLHQAYEGNPSDPKRQRNLCAGYGATRRYKEAIKCYDELLATAYGADRQIFLQQQAQAYYLQPDRYKLQGGNRKKAIEIYRRLVDEGYGTALLDLGITLDTDGQHDEAITLYDKFLAEDHPPKEMAIAHLNKSVALGREHLHVEALHEDEEALRYAPHDVLVLVHKGTDLADAGYLDAGIALLTSLEDENHGGDTAPFLLLQLGNLLRKKGDLCSASNCFRRATRLQPNFQEAHFALAKAAAQLGRTAEAIEEYAFAAKLSGSELDRADPDFLAREWTANALRDGRKYAAAAAMYREALKLKPQDGDARFALASVLEKIRDAPQAIQAYREILRTPDQLDVSGFTHNEIEANRKSLLALTHRGLGEALIKLGKAQWSSGINELRAAVELNASDPDFRMSLGDGYYSTGRFVEAVSEYREVISIAPESTAAQAKLRQAEQRANL